MMFIVFFPGGLIILIICAELLVCGASRLAATFGVSPQCMSHSKGQQRRTIDWILP